MMTGYNEIDVIIVDDDPANCLLLRKILGYKGKSVGTAQGLEEVRGMLEQNIPRILILDLFLGDTSGFDCLKRMRLEYDLSRTQVIIYTAQQIDYSLKKEYERNYDCRILEKLMDQDRLFSMIL